MIFVFGSTGFLGNNLCKLLKEKKIEYKKFTSKKNEKKKRNTFYMYYKKPYEEIKDNDCIVFFSSQTSVKKIEKKKFFYSNFNKKLIHILKKINSKAKIIFISSDYVYSGTKKIYFDNDIAKPKNFYGKFKIEIEQYIKRRFSNYIILRSCKIFSNKISFKTIYREIYKKLKKKKKFEVFVDQKIHLLNLEDFLFIIFKLLNKKKSIVGNFNLVGKKITRFEFSNLISKKFNLNSKFIVPIKFNKNKFPYIPKNLDLKSNLYRTIKFKPNFRI